MSILDHPADTTGLFTLNSHVIFTTARTITPVRIRTEPSRDCIVQLILSSPAGQGVRGASGSSRPWRPRSIRELSPSAS